MLRFARGWFVATLLGACAAAKGPASAPLASSVSAPVAAASFDRLDDAAAPTIPVPSAEQRQPPLDVPLEVVVPVAPAVLPSENAMHLVYELHVTNFSRRSVTLHRIESLNGETKARVGMLEGSELADAIMRPGAGTMEASQRAVIAAGQRAVVFMWLDLTAPAPKELSHELHVTLGDAKEVRSLLVPRVAVSNEPPFLAAPPLRGGDWLAGNAPSRMSDHRRSLIPVGGRPHIAQRFAIDWAKVKDGTTFSGDQKSNASYFCYGADALAIADGTVVETKDGIAENVPGKPPEPVTLENIAGNHVVLRLAKNRFALYAHFKPSSLKVRVGDQVKKGQVLGLVGNSGNSTEPHLHVHVSDDVPPLGAEGVPWVIDAFEARAQKSTAFSRVTRELPAEDSLVRFVP